LGEIQTHGYGLPRSESEDFDSGQADRLSLFGRIEHADSAKKRGFRAAFR